MNNPAGTPTSRAEEIAFLALEQVLGIQIELADAGAGDGKPDGSWVDPDDGAYRGVVEVTSPPNTTLMEERAAAKRDGCPHVESGLSQARSDSTAQELAAMLAEDWAKGNFNKLLAEQADERHLFLNALGNNVADDFYRLSDSHEDGAIETVEDLILPHGITDVWFLGRARRVSHQRLGATEFLLARLQTSSGWQRYTVKIEEQVLPAPTPSIADDPAPTGWRRPRNRRSKPADG